MNNSDTLNMFSALSQESRLAIFKLLVKYGEEGLCASDIGKKLNIPKNTLSFHLLLMTNAKLLKKKKQGTFIFYSPNFASVNGLIKFLLADCCDLATKKDYCTKHCHIHNLHTHEK
ncbi:DNA-binding transcriptional ArsR family regulator [Elusimicrobium posterum]|uniref:ArsR/SmtB family transcription factor n=1 Tax=Elusimicrobium posterum TaxID=3116653 RepID=UPI003C7851F3